MADFRRSPEVSEAVQFIMDEVSRKVYVAPPSADPSWKTVRNWILVIVALATLAGGLGRAFFADRAAYDLHIQHAAVQQERTDRALDQVNRALTTQNQSLEKLTLAVRDLELRLAAVKPRR